MNGLISLHSSWVSQESKPSDWIAFFGNYSGGIIGGIVAYLISRKQIRDQIKNEEEKRTINQLYGLIKIKYELEKINRNFKSLNNVYTKYLNQRKDIDEEYLDLMAHDLEELTSDNWNDLNLDNMELQINLLDIRDFYSQFREVLSYDYHEISIQIKNLDLKKNVIQNSKEDKSEKFIQISNLDNEIYDLKNQQETLFYKKDMLWDKYRIKGYWIKAEKLSSEVDNLISSIKDLRSKRE